MKILKKIFLNEHFILAIILLNSVIIFLQECNISNVFINTLDLLCTLTFLVEMIVKHIVYGFKGYWAQGWNRLDGTLVILSIPSIIAVVIPISYATSLSTLLILRLLRIIRFFRIVHYFPNFGVIMKNFGKAIKDCMGVFAGFFVLIVIIALISCAIFKDTAPEYFGTPLDSIYSIFRICTGEGWNEIPDAIAAQSTIFTARLVRLYFCILLIICSIIGLSLVNSIFVDAMVSDNNNALEKQVRELTTKIDNLTKLINNNPQK